jgi:hypothetical protein
MNPLLRAFAAALMLGAYLLIWLVLVITDIDTWLPAEGLIALLAAGAIAGWVWRQLGTAPNGVAASVLSGAAIVGGIGFALGFFGPMILAPEANQGPMLGIFITGPGGAVLGAVAGLVMGLRSRRTQS